MSRKKPISTGSEWTFELLQEYDEAIGHIARDYGLDTFRNQIEMISAEQMMDAYASVGMPINYHHWSFGKKFVNIEKGYKRGQMGLAYELVINSNPCISYLMEENSLPLQALVIAHACYGHNSFFKNNYLFQIWTNPDAIVDYLLFARNYISECEQRHGITEVEELLDACHALMNYGVDRYSHPAKLTLQEEKTRQRNREQYIQSQVNELWRTIPTLKETQEAIEKNHFPEEPQENLLYFIEKHAPLLDPWQREIIRIVRKVAQYFYPQRQTKVMNEGWACFWHYHLINDLYTDGLVTDEFMLEFLQTHTNVIAQLPFDHPHFSGLNPYTIGFNLFQDIKRVAENPTEEDKIWLPSVQGNDWYNAVDFAMRNFKDESFIAQYLSPSLIRELKLFSICNDDKEEDLLVTAIHDEAGYQKIRDSLSKQYDLSYIEPNIQIYNVNIKSDRALTLKHVQHDRRPLNEASTQQVLKHLYRLWQFPVILETVDIKGKILSTQYCPEQSRPGP